MLLVTGGAGFIGSNFITEWFRSHDESILTLDADLCRKQGQPQRRRTRPQTSLCRRKHSGRSAGGRSFRPLPSSRRRTLRRRKPRRPFNFRPSGVRRHERQGNDGSSRCCTPYWLTLDDEEKAAFRFINISTDEVYGSMTVDTPPNTEATPFDPSSPYSASKAAADPVRTRLLQNLRPARRHGEMHQQLRSQTVPGKTSALHADARPSGQDAPRLRRRRADPRLDPCTRLLSSTANDSGKGGTGRHIQRRRLQ